MCNNAKNNDFEVLDFDIFEDTSRLLEMGLLNNFDFNSTTLHIHRPIEAECRAR